MDQEEKKHQRRVRYKGTHPRSFKEKYKEHQPEKYADTVEKVIKKGSTPAGMHLSIMVDEILSFFQIQPHQVGFDATLGYGGHTLEMLKALGSSGHIHATDVDPLEIVKTRERLAQKGYGPDRFTAHLRSFSEIDQVVQATGTFDFILADLGVSSMQIDNPDRGFSYKIDGPLDLRLNPLKGTSAAERLKSMTKDELEGMLIENADEPYAAPIAKEIIATLKKGAPIATTSDLRRVITSALAKSKDKPDEAAIKKSCQRCFQALRIDVNDEFEVLYDFLEKLPLALKSGGRVAILTFHSGEDRLVKKSFQRLIKDGVYREIAPSPLRPTPEECLVNSRAKSTKMRWAIKA